MSFRGGYYPEILDRIVDCADYATRLQLRAVSSHLCKRVDAVLATHLAWRDGIMYTRTDATENRHPLSVLNGDLEFATLWHEDNIPAPIPPSDCRPSRSHMLSASACASLLNETLGHTRIFDLDTSIHVEGFLDLPEGIVLSISPDHGPGPTVLRVFTPSTDTIVLKRPPINIQQLNSDKFDLSFALPVFTGYLPSRVVVHIDDATLNAGVDLVYCRAVFCRDIRGAFTAQEPENGEVVIVITGTMLTNGHDFGAFLKSLLCPKASHLWLPHSHSRNSRLYSLVNPTSQISGEALHAVQHSFPQILNLSTLEIGDIIRAILAASTDDFKPNFRYICQDEWAAELGEERFKLEMGL